MDRTSAILINRTRLTETSLIVHWCSADCGLFKTVAKGALRPKSPFAGRLDLFATCDVTFVRSGKSDLHTLREAHLTALRPHLRDSYARVLAAAYFCRLIEMVAEREASLGGLHELLRLALDHLDAHEPSPKLVARFENRLCEELGLGQVRSGGGALLEDYFHRPLPPQREELLKQMTSA
jgi:DNA repair protein RecO (recombination protein O)